MKKKSICALILSLLSFYSANILSAQIQKGLTSIDGALEANYSSYRIFPIERKPAYENTYLSFTPSIHHFVSNHISVGGKIGYTKDEHFFNTNGYMGGQFFVIQPSVKYFFNPKSKWNLYAGLQLSYENKVEEYVYTAIKNNIEIYGANLNLGFNRFLNKQIALDGKISFGVYKGLYSYFYSALSEIRLKNYMNLKDQEELENGNIAKNRILIDGNILLFDSEKIDLTAQLHYGHFIAKRLAVGGKVYIIKSGRYNDIGFAVLPYVQYYHPITKKLFAQAKVFGGVGDGFYYGGSLGINYFLTPYVMVEANLLEGSKIVDYWRYLTTVGPNVGLKYFLR
jgi:hypothetical protein